MIGLRAGRLRHCVDIQSKSEARDALGGFTETWVTDETRYASIEPIKAKEVLRGDQVDSRITHKIIMRFYPGLEAVQRIRFGFRIFNILSIINVDERDHQMEILVTEDKKVQTDQIYNTDGEGVYNTNGKPVFNTDFS